MKEQTKVVLKKLIEEDEHTIEMIKLSPSLAVELLEKKINFLRKQIVDDKV
jgi:hypothetical protein